MFPSKKSSSIECSDSSDTYFTASDLSEADDEMSFAAASEGADEPDFMEMLSNKFVEEGKSVQLECVVAGYPCPTVEWLHNRKPVRDGEEYKIQQDGNKHTLLIPCIYPEDGGMYIAEAINEAGSEMSCAELQVIEIRSSDEDDEQPNFDFYKDDGQPIVSSSSEEEEEEEEEGEIEDTGEVQQFEEEDEEEVEEERKEEDMYFSCPLRKRTYVKEGRRVTLQCEVEGGANANVLWLKDEEELPKDSKRHSIHHREEGVHRLEISKVTLADKGDYICVLTDGEREIRCATQLIMKEHKHTPWDPIPAKFITQIKEHSVKEGKQTTFECEVAGNPTPEVNWLFEGQFLEETQNIRTSFDGKVATLELLSTQKDDAGTYSCQVFNGLAQKQRTSAKLKVQGANVRKFALKAPSFTDKSEDQRVSEGQNVEFSCHVHGNPKPKVAWFFNNEEIKESNYFHFDHSKDQYIIRIEEAFPEDEGEYVCRATNSNGKKEWRVRLTVDEQKTSHYPLDNSKLGFSRPSFLTHLADHKVHEMDTVTFECKVLGNPEPEVIWFHRGKEIVEDGQSHILEYNENGICMLIMPRVKMDNAGKYVCVARSSLGVANSIAVLSITERSPEELAKFNRQHSDASSSGSTDIPLPPKTRPNSEVLTQKSVLLSWETSSSCSCSGSENNTPSVSYIVEAKELSTPDWSLVAADVIDTSLLVRHLNPDGEYTFRVRSESDSGISEPSEETDLIRPKEAVAERDLELPPIPPNKPRLRRQSTFSAPPETEPVIVVEEEDVYALREGKALLTCTVMGEPRPRVMWLRDDEVIEESDHMKWGYEEDGRCWLEIDGVTYHDIGEYECIAISTGGYASERLYVDVAEKPHFLVRFQDTMATVGEPLRLDCRLDGIPEPDIIWYKDDQPLQPGEGVDFLFEGEDMVSLLIDKCVPEDDGEYTLTAINMAGEETNTARVFVVEPEDNALKQRVTIKRDVKVEDEYEILAELGRGAYGVVKRCVSHETGEMCAAKFITVKSGRWTEIRREVKVMAVLDHKRLIKLIDAFEMKRELIMIMELVTGGELFERIISQDYITEREAVHYIKQLVEGVHHMHEKKIIHLDLKPENILLVSPDSEEIKLIDFGLARIVRPGVNIICKFGTPEFVAPEVVRGHPVTTSSDAWSVGIIAYLLLSGISPFMGDDDKETLRNVRTAEWEFDDPVWDQVSDDAQDFIARILISDPDMRLSMSECLEHPWLEQKVEKAAVLSTERLKSFNSRRKWAKALTAVKSAMRLRRLSSIGGFAAGRALLAKAAAAEKAEGKESEETKEEKKDGGDKTVEETEPAFEVQLKDALVLEDNDLELTCEVKGQPPPTVEWFHDDKKISESKNIEMKLDDGKAYLKIVELKEDDAGDYKCVATNSKGTASTIATVTLTDKPDIPCRPRVPLISSTEAFVTWKPPMTGQHVKITGYTLQYKKVGEKQWSLNSDTVQDLHMHVMALHANTEYRFRIACRCPQGIGPYSRSSTPVKTLGIGSPPLSLEAISALCKRTRSQSLDRMASIKEEYSFEIDEDLADLTLKMGLPQKAYEFGVEIGRGRYSVVRRCRQFTTSQEYAAKLVLLTKSNQQKKLVEYELLKEIKHPNLLQLYDVYQTQRYLVLISQRYFGSDLLKHLTRVDKYNELQIMRYVKQILGALDYLHSRNIAHLDLRHDNVLLASRRKDVVRIIDMGSAVQFRPEEEPEGEVIEPDTLPEFLAPELVLDRPADCRTDMWSLGVIIFTWLSGYSPFLGRNRVKTLYNITRMKYNLSRLFKNSSGEATMFIRALLKKEPSDRLSATEALEFPWITDAAGSKDKTVFSSHKLRLYRNDYKLRVAALNTRETMTMRRYSSPLEARLTAQMEETAT